MSSLTNLAVLKVLGGVAVGLASFWITLKILDLQQPSPPVRLITILEATYGLNCNDLQSSPPGRPQVSVGNITNATADQCNRTATCTFKVDNLKFGDPAPGCVKEFSVEWRCADAPAIQKANVAEGKAIKLTCE
jgi:hypothetical protein